MKELDEFGRSELHYASVDKDSENTMRLIADGADVNLADRNNWTPLHFAAQSFSFEIARALLNAGATVDVRDNNGNTPLSTAVFNCGDQDGSVIALLRSAGANPYAENEYGVSPLNLARTIGNYDVAKYFSDLSPSDERRDQTTDA